MGITFDYTNCLAEAIGATHGLIKSEVDTLVAKFPKHHENVDELRKNGESAFFDLPTQDLGPLKNLLKQHQGQWQDVLVVASGGSAWSIRCVLGALTHHAYPLLDVKLRKGPRIQLLDNPDPRRLADALEAVDLKKTLVYVVSRSGSTVETLVIFTWLTDLLKKKVGKGALTSHVLIATDKDKGGLAEIAKLEKLTVLPIPANLGGRYAVLGSATLFVAGLCGIDYAALLKGGGDMDRRCRNGDAANNPAYMHSLVHYLLTRKRRKTIHQTVAYGDRVSAVAQWYDHLLAVSLGKMLNRKGKAVHVGPSPMSARGAFDNHGQMQLIAEGPFDKVITFITVRDHGVKIQAPVQYPKIESAAFAGNAECGALMDHAFVAAERSVTVSGRPNCVIILDRVDEAHIGGLVYLLQLSTAMSAELYGIDPFDQPLVEQNKHAAYAQLGRAGFEDLGRKLAEHRKLPRRTC